MLVWQEDDGAFYSQRPAPLAPAARGRGCLLFPLWGGIAGLYCGGEMDVAHRSLHQTVYRVEGMKFTSSIFFKKFSLENTCSAAAGRWR